MFSTRQYKLHKGATRTKEARNRATMTAVQIHSFLNKAVKHTSDCSPYPEMRLYNHCFSLPL